MSKHIYATEALRADRVSPMTLDAIGQTQRDLLRALLHHKDGLTIDALMTELSVSRNAVRQHLTALEGVGWVKRGEQRPSGGRPEQLYVLSELGHELFPRQYSWFAELLLDMARRAGGQKGAQAQL